MQHAVRFPAPDPAPVEIRAPYTLALSPVRRQLRMTIAGFWGADTMANFIADLKAAVTALGCERDFTICCDISHALIQPQDVIRSFGGIILEGEPRARRVAFWTSAPLPKMQARRLTGLSDYLAIFDSEAEAQSWLTER